MTTDHFKSLLETKAPDTGKSDFETLVDALRHIRALLGMDVIFVSEFLHGSRIFRFVDAASGTSVIKVGDSDPLDESYCQRIVDGRLPSVIPDAMASPAAREIAATAILGVRAHLSVPIVLRDGRVYGTVCCFSQSMAMPELDEVDAQALRDIAGTIASGLERTGSTGILLG